MNDAELQRYAEWSLDRRKNPEFVVARLVRRGVSLERAKRAVEDEEDEHRRHPEKREQRLLSERPFSLGAATAGAIGCFLLCWMATVIISGMNVGSLLDKVAGIAVGAFMTGWSKESKFNGVRVGSAIGWGAYLVTMAAYWATTHDL